MINKMDYLNAINQNIDMVRGDSLIFNFTLKGLESQSAYEDVEVTFSASDTSDGDALITASIDDGIELVEYDDFSDVATFTVCLVPAKTKDLDVARYYYDLQISFDDNVATLMRGFLTLLWEISQ